MPALGSMSISCPKESQTHLTARVHPVSIHKEQNKARLKEKSKKSPLSSKNFLKNFMMFPLFLFCLFLQGTQPI